MDLGVLRDQIDDIDKQIIRLFEERMDVAEQVARYKIGCGKPVHLTSFSRPVQLSIHRKVRLRHRNRLLTI